MPALADDLANGGFHPLALDRDVVLERRGILHSQLHLAGEVAQRLNTAQHTEPAAAQVVGERPGDERASAVSARPIPAPASAKARRSGPHAPHGTTKAP